jgi:uncharacterized protein YjbI with pentapeptide repeats
VAEQEHSRWRPSRRQLLWAGATVGLLTIAILIGYRYDITLWAWIKILIVPAAIAIVVAWINWAQRQREREADAAQEREREATEEARRQRELEVEDQRAQDEARQGYLAYIGQLLLDKNKQVRQAQTDDVVEPTEAIFKSSSGHDVDTLAHTSTLTILRRLDSERKSTVLQFLYESGLLNERWRELVYQADLSKAALSGVRLVGANMFGAILREADLSEADLSEARLIEVDLKHADLSGAYLIKAQLVSTDLSGANLSGANLRRAFGRMSLFRGADLSYADLSGAGGSGITNEELEQQAGSLEGAIMPNGQKYEDWLKSKGGGEDGENTGSS